MTTYRIYALIDPNNGAARYVGQTATHLGQRLADHLRVRGTSTRAEWIRSLIQHNTAPRIAILEQIDGTRRDAYQRESYWIRTLRAQGHSLVNVP